MSNRRQPENCREEKVQQDTWVHQNGMGKTRVEHGSNMVGHKWHRVIIGLASEAPLLRWVWWSAPLVKWRATSECKRQRNGTKGAQKERQTFNRRTQIAGWFVFVKLLKSMDVMTNIAIENGHLYWVFPLKMVIFHSYVSLPEGIIFMTSMVLLFWQNLTNDCLSGCWVLESHLTRLGVILATNLKQRVKMNR